MKNDELCCCGSGKTFATCCGAILSGKARALTALDLMRARYSAFVTSNVDFLYQSSGQKIRDEFDAKATRQWIQETTWQGFDVLSTVNGEAEDTEGYVTFEAHYTTQGHPLVHHESAYFQKLEGEWRFIDGDVASNPTYQREAPKIGRNDPCPCGSGKKYKKCCGKGQ